MDETGEENTISLSFRSRLISNSNDSFSGNRRTSGVPSCLLARAEVLALALLSPAAILLRSRKAAVGADTGEAASGLAAKMAMSNYV
jgi:hypothetical protein